MIKKTQKSRARRNVKQNKYRVYLTAGCLCILLSALLLVIFASRGGGAGGQPVPPDPGIVLNKPVDFLALSDFRKRDLKLIEELISDTDEKRRKDNALEQWENLWPHYLAWFSQCVETESGIKVYGPRASAWLNEILWAMIQREDISHGSLKNWSSDPPRERAPKADYWIGIGGLDGDPYLWSVFEKRRGDKVLKTPEEEVRKKVVDALGDVRYPFENGIFNGVEIFVLPSHGLFDKKTTWGKCGSGQTTGGGIHPGGK